MITLRQNSKSTLFFAVAAAATLHTSLAAGQSVPAGIVACAYEQNSTARLACYDKQNPPRTEARPEESHSPAVAAAPPAPPVAAHVAPPVAAPSAPPVAAAPAAPVAHQTTAAEFGLSGDVLRKKQASASGAAPTGEIERIDAHVTKVTQRPTGELLLVLDNGQTWTQAERKAGIVIRAGEAVTISKGAFGSFYVSSPSRVTTRVRRLD